MAGIESLFLLLIPPSVSGVIWLVIKSIIVFFVIVLADKIIAHEIETKHAFMVSIASYLLIPIATTLLLSFVNLPFQISAIFFYGLPLLVWLALGEFFIQGADRTTKLKIAFIAFVAYLALDFFGAQTGIPQFIRSYIPY